MYDVDNIARKLEQVCDEYEIFVSRGRSMLARSSLNKVEACTSTISTGVGIRLIKDGRMGSSYFARQDQINSSIKTALKIAKLSPKENMHFASKSHYDKVKQYDERVAQLDEEQLVSMLTELVDSSTSFSIKSIKAEVSSGVSDVHVVNSAGVDVADKTTVFSATAIAKTGDVTGFDYYSKRRLSTDIASLGKSAREWAKKSLGAKPISFEGDIIVDPEVIADLFSALVEPALDAERVKQKTAMWRESLGKQVAAEDITIEEKPHLDYEVGTVAFDDEGVPTHDKAIIEAGVLKSFLYDLRFASLLRKKPSGNGFRGAFASPVGISPTNLVLSAKHTEDVFDVQKAVYVKELMGMHNANANTGDFALDIAKGFMVEHGKLTAPIRKCMLVSNIFKLLLGINGVDKETSTKSWMHTPALRFKGKVVG